MELRGWITEDKHCPNCGAPQIYYDDYDAYFLRSLQHLAGGPLP
jgi:hypothetical protein